MQEEIEHKTVNLAISTTKLSARTLLRGMQFLLRQYDKHASQGKQSMKRLVRQNRGVTNVEIQRTGIKDFDRYASRTVLLAANEAVIDSNISRNCLRSTSRRFSANLRLRTGRNTRPAIRPTTTKAAALLI